jgi:hypothetical protein
MEGSSSIATSRATDGELATAQRFVLWSVMTTVEDVFVSPYAREWCRDVVVLVLEEVCSRVGPSVSTVAHEGTPIYQGRLFHTRGKLEAGDGPLEHAQRQSRHVDLGDQTDDSAARVSHE